MKRDEKNLEREAHIWSFVLEHDLDIAVGSRRGRAHYARPSRGESAGIAIPPIRGQVSYFVALHELGHLLSPGNRAMRLLDSEADAWRWAFANTEEEPTAATRRAIFRRLRSYFDRAMRRTNIAEPGPDFKRLLAELHEGGAA